MSIKVMSLVYSATIGDLNYSHINKGGKKFDRNIKGSVVKSVLLAYADHANEDGRSTYPSQKLLAKKTELTTVTINNAVKALRQNEFLFDDGISHRGTKSYIMNLPKLTPLNHEVNPIESKQLTPLTRTVLEPSVNHHSPEGEISLENQKANNQKTHQEADKLMADLRARDKTTVKKSLPVEKLQIDGIEAAIFAGRKTTERDIAASRGETIGAVLETWKTDERIKDIARKFSQEFHILPPKFGAKFYFSWLADCKTLTEISGTGDLLHIIKDVAIDYDGWNGIKSPHSILSAVYKKMNTLPEELETFTLGNAIGV